MTTLTKTWIHGLGAGAVAAALDVALILSTDPTASVWVPVEAALFWTIAGWIVVSSESGLPRYAHGIVTTVLLNLPWYVVVAFAAGHPERFVPLVAMSVVFGSGFAWARGHARREAPPSREVARA